MPPATSAAAVYRCALPSRPNIQIIGVKTLNEDELIHTGYGRLGENNEVPHIGIRMLVFIDSIYSS